jgi:type II restriction enzyme
LKLALVREQAEGYSSGSQRARRLTEHWAAEELYCPACSERRLSAAPANTPAFDFACPACDERFQLKSTRHAFGRRIMDSEYGTMIRAIRSDRAPGLFVLRYEPADLLVLDLILVPHFFLLEESIEKRRPLSASARRAGWTGCNIRLDRIPADGVIPLVAASQARPVTSVRADYSRLRPLEGVSLRSRGWTVDVLRCVRALPAAGFALEDVYGFETALARLHPGNRFVRAKIRQQLQVLRDHGVVEFMARGRYRARDAAGARFTIPFVPPRPLPARD